MSSSLRFVSQQVQHARQCGDLYFASLISKETMAAVFGEASSILRSARVYNTSVTLRCFCRKSHAFIMAVPQRSPNGRIGESEETDFTVVH